MEQITETYYKAKDGRKFETKEECELYETEEERYKTAKTKKNEAEKEMAVIEYARFLRNGGYAKQATESYGCGHDGYHTKCPYCGKETGGYEMANCRLKVSKGIYKCENCGEFFGYS